MSMPNKFPLKPLPFFSLVPQLDSNLIEIAVGLLHAPFSESNAAPPLLHRTNVLGHGLQDRGISQGSVSLDEGKGFRGPLIRHRIERGWRDPQVVQHAESQDGEHRIMENFRHGEEAIC